jgi:hypothetical protein
MPAFDCGLSVPSLEQISADAAKTAVSPRLTAQLSLAEPRKFSSASEDSVKLCAIKTNSLWKRRQTKDRPEKSGDQIPDLDIFHQLSV